MRIRIIIEFNIDESFGLSKEAFEDILREALKDDLSDVKVNLKYKVVVIPEE